MSEKTRRPYIIVVCLIMIMLTGCSQSEVKDLRESITKHNTRVENIKRFEATNKEVMGEYKKGVIEGLQEGKEVNEEILRSSIKAIHEKIMEATVRDVLNELRVEQEDEGKWGEDLEYEKELKERVERQNRDKKRDIEYREYTSTSDGTAIQEFNYKINGLKQPEIIGVHIKWDKGEIQSIETVRIGG